MQKDRRDADIIPIHVGIYLDLKFWQMHTESYPYTGRDLSVSPAEVMEIGKVIPIRVGIYR